MPKIELKISINADKATAYDVLKNIEDFPQFIKNINNVEIEEYHNGKTIAEWNITIDGANISWKEETTFYDQDLKVEFRMLEGDYNEYEGSWVIEESPAGTLLHLSVNIDWGVPGLMRFVGPIIEKKTRRALIGFLKGIKRKAEMNG